MTDERATTSQRIRGLCTAPAIVLRLWPLHLLYGCAPYLPLVVDHNEGHSVEAAEVMTVSGRLESMSSRSLSGLHPPLIWSMVSTHKRVHKTDSLITITASILPQVRSYISVLQNVCNASSLALYHQRSKYNEQEMETDQKRRQTHRSLLANRSLISSICAFSVAVIIGSASSSSGIGSASWYAFRS